MSYDIERKFDNGPAESREEGHTVSDIAEVRHRLVLVEEQVIRLIEDSAATNAMAALADRDVAAYRQEMRSHIRVINALRETQIEQGQVQAAQSRELGVLRETQLEQGRELVEHRRILDQHTTILDEQGKILDQHTTILGMHSQILDRHTAMLNQHTAMLDENSESLTSLVAGQAGLMRRLDSALRHLGIAEEAGSDPSQN